MNLREAFRLGAGRLKKAGILEAEATARIFLEWAAQVTLEEYALYPERVMTKEQERIFLEAIAERERRVPLQYITGEQEFMGLSFRVNRHVLIPRQDTEILVEEALKRIRKGMDILDLCTGSGCIPISLEWHARKKGRADETNKFTGSDVSSAAIQIARENGSLHGSRAAFLESDLFDRLQGQSYDMILSNPPYIPSAVIATLEQEVRGHEPVLALDGREDGLYFYRKIVKDALGHLKKGGWLLFEIGYDQGESVAGLMREAGYGEINVVQDLAGLDRTVIGRYDV